MEHKQHGKNNWTAEKVMVHSFNGATGKWHYDIPYEVLFPEKNGSPCKEYKAVKIVLDNVDMFMFKKEMVKRRCNEYVCDGMPPLRSIEEYISVKFNVKYSYGIFRMLGEWRD